jgi:pantetheine-phosphate adenylyltransferase
MAKHSPTSPGAARRALFPGTFDPVTLGHVDLVRRAAALFDEVVVAPAAHHDKRHVFSVDERVALLREATEGIPGVSVEPLAGLLVDGAARLGARTVVRGIRNATDLEYERQMAHTNRAMAPWLDTVLLLSSPEHAHVSSTLVRQIARLGGDVRLFVPPHVAEALRMKLQDPQRHDHRNPNP